jgi:hypothetical protein
MTTLLNTWLIAVTLTCLSIQSASISTPITNTCYSLSDNRRDDLLPTLMTVKITVAIVTITPLLQTLPWPIQLPLHHPISTTIVLMPRRHLATPGRFSQSIKHSHNTLTTWYRYANNITSRSPKPQLDTPYPQSSKCFLLRHKRPFTS